MTDREVILSKEASSTWLWLRDEYVKAGYPEYFNWVFKCDANDRQEFAELRAHRLIVTYNVDPDEFVLTERGLDLFLNRLEGDDELKS